VLGIMPKDKSWFPQASMQAMLDAIAELITPFEQRIACGELCRLHKISPPSHENDRVR
jgi:hypothetical protein